MPNPISMRYFKITYLQECDLLLFFFFFILLSEIFKLTLLTLEILKLVFFRIYMPYPIWVCNILITNITMFRLGGLCELLLKLTLLTSEISKLNFCFVFTCITSKYFHYKHQKCFSISLKR